MDSIESRFSARAGGAGLPAHELAAAYLVDVMAELMVVTDGYVQRGEADPEWLERCQGLMRGAFEQLVPQVPWEQLVILASRSANDIPR